MALYAGPFVPFSCTLFVAATPASVVERDGFLECPQLTRANQSDQGRAVSREKLVILLTFESSG